MANTPTSDQERREAEVVSRHLPLGYSAEPDAVLGSQGNPASSAPDLLDSGRESSLKLQGGDIHRDLFKLNARARLQQRAATFSHTIHDRPPVVTAHGGINATDQRAPGGFRRQFLERQHRRFHSVTTPVTKNFVQFLDLYGNFAGEDLAESEDDSTLYSEDEESRATDVPSETRPLLGRRQTSRLAKKPGDASTTKSFFTLLKAFVGTGIMFLPKAFNNGGIIFSSITLVTVALVSCLCFHLLLQCRKRYGGGYGELGEAIGGPRLRSLILSSITISQIGFVCSGMVFTAENLLSFVTAVSPGMTPLSTNALIAIQLVVLVPLAMIRKISKLGPAALLADVFILIGLIYIWQYDISAIASHGIHESVQFFNPKHFTLTMGSAIFTFEGIGLLLPIQSSMKEPEKFSRLLYIVMLIITIIFTSVGALCYLTFGSATQTEVISNFPQSSKLVNAVQFLYSLAVLVGTPVQLFPAVRIMEGKIFGHSSGKRSSSTKWTKNAFRTGIVLVSGCIAAFGASDLDKFVALIGSFACVPLVYIYPAFLHYKGVAGSRLVAGGDLLLMVIGLVVMVYTTFITLSQWVG